MHCSLPVNVGSSAREASKLQHYFINEATTCSCMSPFNFCHDGSQKKKKKKNVCQISPVCNRRKQLREILECDIDQVHSSPRSCSSCDVSISPQDDTHQCECNSATCPICHRYFLSVTDINVCEALTSIITMCYVLKMSCLMPHGCSQHFINHI